MCSIHAYSAYIVWYILCSHRPVNSADALFISVIVFFNMNDDHDL